MKYSTKVVLQIEEEIGVYTVLEKNEYDYDGPVELACGPSSGEENAAGSATNLSNTLSGDFNSRFAGQDSILQQLNGSLSPILSQGGPSQAGWSPQEAGAISTATINNNAAANRNAQQKWQSTLAGRGDDSGLQSGVDKQILGSVASTSANNLANQQTANTVANYTQGNANWQKALAGTLSSAQLYDPAQFGSEATSANENAFNDQNTITQQKNQEEASIAGGITGLVGAAIPFANSSNALSAIGGGKIFGSGGVFGGG